MSKKITIKPSRKEDKEMARIMEKIAEYHFEQYGGIIQAVTSARMMVYTKFGADIDDFYWNNILAEIVKERIVSERNNTYIKKNAKEKHADQT